MEGRVFAFRMVDHYGNLHNTFQIDKTAEEEAGFREGKS